MKKYRIVAGCDPYNAKFRYNGEPVLSRDGATPTKWEVRGEMTEDEAREELWKMLLERAEAKGFSNMRPEDAEGVEDMAKMIAEDEEMDIEDTREMFTWFQGEGVYTTDSNDLVMLKGGDAFHDDVLTFRIEEMD